MSRTNVDKAKFSAVHKEREQWGREWLQFADGRDEQDGWDERDKRHKWERQGYPVGLALSALSCIHILWTNVRLKQDVQRNIDINVFCFVLMRDAWMRRDVVELLSDGIGVRILFKNLIKNQFKMLFLSGAHSYCFSWARRTASHQV